MKALLSLLVVVIMIVMGIVFSVDPQTPPASSVSSNGYTIAWRLPY